MWLLKQAQGSWLMGPGLDWRCFEKGLAVGWFPPPGPTNSQSPQHWGQQACVAALGMTQGCGRSSEGGLDHQEASPFKKIKFKSEAMCSYLISKEEITN